MNVEAAIRARVSVKDFTAAAVPPDRIEHLLDLAVLAPNHRMTEPVRFRVLGPDSRRVYAEALAERKTRKMDDPEAERAVREKVVRRTVEVPSMIGVVMEQNEDPEIREEDYATAFMAIQNLSLVAVEIGLGTHIKTGAVMGEPGLRDALEVGDDERLVAIVFLGVPAAPPDAKSRTPASELTRWLD